MGGCWSSKAERCTQCPRRAVNNLLIINGVCECCSHDATRRERPGPVFAQHKAQFGEFRCPCGRSWSSVNARRGKYQQCKLKDCKREVKPFKVRDVRPSDFDGKSSEQHPTELCEMCKQLGRYCGNFKGNRGPSLRRTPTKGNFIKKNQRLRSPYKY